MDWNEVTALATAAAAIVTLCAFVATAIYVISAVRAFEKDQFVGASGELFAIFQSRDFMNDQLWIIHDLDVKTWPEFIAAHRGKAGEVAFYRVGSVYNRVGNLIRMRFIKPGDILPTIGPYAIAIWNKIAPLVREARRLENSTLFMEFERILPDCYECYVPALGIGTEVTPFAAIPSERERQKRDRNEAALRIDLDEARRELERGRALLLDVRQPASIEKDSASIPGSLRIPPDEIEQRYTQLPRGREIITFCA